MAHPLEGIRKKIERAKENIKDLRREIDFFLDYGIKPNIPDDDVKSLEELKKVHLNRPVPPRLSVLIGEIVHQLRSTLDHLAWQLSDTSYRSSFPRRIEFPIYIFPIKDPDELKSFDRKVKGFTPSVKARIEGLQPRSSADPLAILHEMDVVEKHRELLLVVSAFEHVVTSPITETEGITFYAHADVPLPVGNVNMRGEYSAQVSFAQFGILQHQPVVPSLTQLLYAVEEVILIFEGEF